MIISIIIHLKNKLCCNNRINLINLINNLEIISAFGLLECKFKSSSKIAFEAFSKLLSLIFRRSIRLPCNVSLADSVRDH